MTGQYGRIEKSKNLQLAGAAGMILANTDEQGESIVAAEFCIPGIHIGDLDGDDLRSWLETGSNHKGNITGFDRIIDNALGDRVSSSSSRGPNPPPAQDIMKPNVIAPGTSILGAYTPTPFIFLSGTSMASPHIAGAAALLLGTDNSMTPSMISSALELTAAPELATDFDGSFATPHERGAGRPILRDAANNGIYFNETEAGFISANPAIGGVPRDLNLPSLTDAACEQQCSFTRTVTDRAGGRSWTATAEGFPAGVVSTVSPASFTLGNGGSRELQFNFDLRNADVIGSWVYGNIVLRSSGLPDAVMPVVLFATGGELPVEWEIFASQESGWQDFELQGLINMPQATFTSGGLVAPQATSQNLPQDPTNLEPYDGGSGIFTVWHSVTEEDLWLHTRTSSPTAPDVDLYVGIDANRDGVADEEEEICSSTTPFDAERCDILNPTPGDYWIIVQNWTSGPSNNDQLDLVSAVVGPDSGSGLVATGPGMTQGGEPFDVRVSWNNMNALEGEELLGAVGFGTSADKPANIGVIPLFWSRLNVGAAKTLPLVEGREHRFVVGPNGMHDRAFIDIPPGATSLNITASGGDSVQNAGLSLALHRVEFDDAFSEAPLAAPAPAGTPVASASGSSGGGPVLEVSGGSLQPGRWYVVVSNSNPNSSAVSLRADVESSGQKVPVKGNLLISVNRGGISQGIDYQPVGAAHGLIWYTYYDNHKPAWYLASGIADDSNFWSGSLLRFTNDGAADRFERVGVASVTMLDNTDSIFSWTLFGESGSERMGLVTGQDANPCPQIGGQATSISGFWGRAQAGLGGASVLLTDAVHAEIHYLYDGGGYPVWLQAAGANGDGLTMTQFEGDCPTCATTSVSSTNVGVLTPEFSSAMNGQWNQDYTLVTPLAGQVDRDDMVVKISSIRACD
jgi:hypothetical protein